MPWDEITHWGLVGGLAIGGPVVAYLVHRAESQQRLAVWKTVPPRSNCSVVYRTQRPGEFVDWQA